MEYKLEKRVWTDGDFDVMGWHDSTVYWMHLDEDLVLDIDYILEWVEPDILGHFSFIVAPATLVFKQPQRISFGIDGKKCGIEISEIKREITDIGTFWTIDTVEGEFSFYSEGYVQYFRQEPFYEYGQQIDFYERGGYCLERTTNQDNPKRYSEDVLRHRQKEAEHYMIAKQHKILLNKKKELDVQREKDEIDFKTYLIKNREYKKQLKEYEVLLKDTRFEVRENIF